MTRVTNVNLYHFAVVVGIDHYPALNDLKGAQQDARDFQDWLLAPAGGALPSENIRIVEASPMGTPFSEVLPTQRQFDSALLTVHEAVRAKIDADTSVWDQTRLYIFVAGHGIKPRDSSGALLMADASWNMPMNIGLAHYLAWQEENALFKEVFVFADCCRTARNLRFSSGPPFTSDTTDRKTIAVLAYATTADKAALASLAYDGRGIFTKALLEALNGAGSNGEVTLDRVQNYINKKLGGRQVSEFIPPRSAAVVVRVPTPGKREVRFRFREPFFGVVELLHRDGSTETLAVPGTDLCLSLKPGLYKLTPLGPGAPEFLERGIVELEPGSEPFDVTL